MYRSSPLAQRHLAHRTAWLVALLALLGAILFPFEWLGARYPAFGLVLGRVFADDARHATGHLALFVLLGLLALGMSPALLGRPRRYFGLLALAGVGQEAFQLLFKRRALVFDDARDLLVDLLGLGLAFIIVFVFRARRARKTNTENGEIAERMQAEASLK